jgi:hypothetical protein
MPGDTQRSEHKQRSEHTKFIIKYSHELSEDVSPEPGIPIAVVGPEKFAKVKDPHINRVFYFLICSSAMCLATVAFVPNSVVQETALAVWTGSAALARFLLAGAYRKSGKATRPVDYSRCVSPWGRLRISNDVPRALR